MKYTILGFQQDKANKLNLNMNDLLLMRTIKDMYSSASMEFILEGGEKYMWVNQDYLHRQIPIIGSKRTMLRILEKLVKLNIVTKVLKHNKGGVRGNFSYIKPTIKMDELQDYAPYDKMTQGLRQNDIRVVTKCHNKDPSIRDPSIRDTKDIVEQSSQSGKPDHIPYQKVIDYLNNKAERNFQYTTRKTQSLIRARWNEGFKVDDFMKVIDNKVVDWKRDPNMSRYLRPETLFGTKFEGYLNEGHSGMADEDGKVARF